MGDRALINSSYGGRQSLLDGEQIMASFGGGGGGISSVIPIPTLYISGTPAAAAVGSGSVFSPLIVGGVQPYTLSVINGSLPGGRAISDVSVIGNYTTAGAYSYTLRVTDSAGSTADLQVSGTVAAASATPTLTLTGPLAYTVGAASGTLVANIGNVPSGATPTITPNDGRLAVAGDAANGWKVVVGLSASVAGNINLVVAATGANSASATIVVTEVSAAEVSTYSFADQGEILPYKPAWMTSGGGPYFPSLISVVGIPVWQGIADYLCYYSTDHASGQGGIGVMECRGDPGVAANWKDHDAAVAAGWFATWTGTTPVPTANPIFKNTRGTSSQTETPEVIYLNGQFAMYYQVAAGGASNVVGPNQPTCRQISADGLNWGTPASSGILPIDYPLTIGNLHAGYFGTGPNPYTNASQFPYIAYSLTGGTDRSSQGMWGATDPINGAWSFVQPLMKPAGRLKDLMNGLVWSFIDADIRSAQVTPQGVSMLGAFGTQGISGGEDGNSVICEVLMDPTGANVIGKPLKLVGQNFAPNTGLGCFTPTTLVANGKRVMIYQAKTTSGLNSLRIATSPIRDPANTRFLPITPELPASRATRTYNFVSATTNTTLPAGLTELAINTLANTVQYEAAGYRFFVESGTVPIPEHYMFEQAFVPSAQQMIEIKVDGLRSTNFSGTAFAYRKFLLGFTSSRTVTASAMQDVLCLSNCDLPSIVGANDLRYAQIVGGSRSSLSAPAKYHPGIGYAGVAINKSAPKYLGIRWFPQLGKAYLLAEGKTALGVEMEEIPLDPAFLPGGSLFNTTLYPFMGLIAENSSRLVERARNLIVVQA